eukprot:12782565-Alexandrium_andersonii.AAC.2
MGIQQEIIRDVVDSNTELRQDSVGHNDERTRSRQGFSRDSPGLQLELKSGRVGAQEVQSNERLIVR